MRITKCQLSIVVTTTVLFTALIVLSTGITSSSGGGSGEPHSDETVQLARTSVVAPTRNFVPQPPTIQRGRKTGPTQSAVGAPLLLATIHGRPTHQPLDITAPEPSLLSPASANSKPRLLSYKTDVPRVQHRARANTVQENKMCLVKYPLEAMEMLKRTLAVRGVRRVAFVGIVKQAMSVLPSMEEAMMQAIDTLSPENVFVSFLESGSTPEDGTPQYLREFGGRLQKLGVSNVISTGHNRISAVFHAGKEGNRINFLARLRNAALYPAMYGYPIGYFDKIFFINDVFICGGDILRLLAHDADIACGLDYEENSRHVYDSWVIRGWAEQFPNIKSFDPKSTDPTSNVFSCWNGGTASRAILWYSGMRFRRGMPELGREDCSQSECSIWAMDAHILGFHNIILDPSVQVGYIWKPYELNFIDSPPHTKLAVDSPNVMTLKLNLTHIPYMCCELGDKHHHIDRSKCNTRYIDPPPKGDCDQNPSKCLRYEASRWEEEWDWESLFQQGANVSSTTLAAR